MDLPLSLKGTAYWAFNNQSKGRDLKRGLEHRKQHRERERAEAEAALAVVHGDCGDGRAH